MNTRSVLVIITYNSEDFIEKCLYSIISQSYKDWFMVIVDNASSDSTVEKIREFRDTYPEITSHNFKLISLKKNTGFAAAVNHAVFNFIGKKKKDIEKYLEFLVLLNPDMYLERDALKNIISTFSKTDENKPAGTLQAGRIGAAGGLVLDYEKDTVQHIGGKVSDNFITSHVGFGESYSGLKQEPGQKKIKGSEPGAIKMIKDVDYITGAFFATDFELFKSIRGFDTGYRPVYFEELDYCLKLKKLGLRIVVNTDSVVRHYEGASVKKFSRSFYKFYHKNRVRCAIINLGFIDFFRKFCGQELKWLKTRATRDQFQPVIYAYFINFLFLPYNLVVKLRNRLILSKIELK
jgi:GT2 family glycosyltransferase